jgi:hypothetical protein
MQTQIDRIVKRTTKDEFINDWSNHEVLGALLQSLLQAALSAYCFDRAAVWRR